MTASNVAARLVACALGVMPLGGLAQPQIGAMDLARARALLELSRAELTVEQFALLSRRLAAAETAYAELTTIARASQAVAAVTESGAAASARATATGGRALLGGVADLLPLLLFIWPATAHAPGMKQETAEVRAARSKVEESLKELAVAARQVESERTAAEERTAGTVRKKPNDPAPDTVPDSWVYPKGQRPCDLIGTGGSGLSMPGGISDWVRCDYLCGSVPQMRKFWGNSKKVCLDPANRPTY